MIKIGVFGYGTIGKRVADAVILQDDMELVGVTANKYNYKITIIVQLIYFSAICLIAYSNAFQFPALKD